MSFVLRVKWLTTLWCQTAHAWLFMYAGTCQRCAIAKRQWGPGQQPSSTAAWQAALALGWPLPPPGCPHSLTSLAWQQQPNKLRAPQSSHRSMGMFFTAPTPLPYSLWSLWSVCCTQTHPHVKWNLVVVYLGVWRNIHRLACSLHQLCCLLISVGDEYRGADLLVGWVKNALKSWHCFVARVGAWCILQSQLQFSKRSSKTWANCWSPHSEHTLMCFKSPEPSRFLGEKRDVLLDLDVPCGEHTPQPCRPSVNWIWWPSETLCHTCLHLPDQQG